MSRVRWYNRVAAWLWDVVGDRIQTLAIPVWEEQAEQDLRDCCPHGYGPCPRCGE